MSNEHDFLELEVFIEIIYVQHDNGIGSGFSKGDYGFEINKDFYPLEHKKL